LTGWTELLKASGLGEGELSWDNIHPTALGQKQLKDILSETVGPLAVEWWRLEDELVQSKRREWCCSSWEWIGRPSYIGNTATSRHALG